MATTARKKTTHYMRLVKAKSSVCSGKGSVTAVKKAASAYVANAVKKAEKAASAGKKTIAGKKAKADAMKKASAVAKRSCRVLKGVGVGKTTAKRKPTKRK
jgi:hypothetical protein